MQRTVLVNLVSPYEAKITFPIVGTTFHEQGVNQVLAQRWPDQVEEGVDLHTMIYRDCLQLVPEPTNQYDPNAVKVKVIINQEAQTIGYLSKELNRDFLATLKLSKELPLGTLKITKRDPICIGTDQDHQPIYQKFNLELVGEVLLVDRQRN